MKLRLILVIVLILIAGGIYFAVRDSSSSVGANMSVEEYVRENISALSPEKEQVGGTFQVTRIEAADGKGVVEYEDGHNAYVADFTYSGDDGGISIGTFTVRK